MQDSQQTSRILKIHKTHKVSATMSGMEVPKKPAVNTTFPKSLEFFVNFQKITKTTRSKCKIPKKLVNSQNSQNSQNLSNYVRDGSSPKQKRSTCNIPKKPSFFLNFEKSQKHQQLQDSQKTSRIAKIPKVSATMSGMEVPNKSAVNARFPKNLENPPNFKNSQSLSNYVWDESSKKTRSKYNIPKTPRFVVNFQKIKTPAVNARFQKNSRIAKIHKIPRKSQQLCLG